MRNKNYKGRCFKSNHSKCGVCRTFDALQEKYAEILEADEEVEQFWCNVPLESEELSEFTTDFFIITRSGETVVRECVFRRLLDRPRTAKLLQQSYEYWLKKNVSDWGIVCDKA